MTTNLKYYGWQRGMRMAQLLPAMDNIATYGIQGVLDGQFTFTSGVAFSPDGERIVVTDTGAERIQILGISGNNMSHQVTYGIAGTSNGTFSYPYCSAFSPDGSRLAVADSANNRVQIFGIDGNVVTYQNSFGPPVDGSSQFRSPHGVAFSPDGTLLAVTDTDNHGVTILGISGSTMTYITVAGGGGSADGQLNKPFGVAFNHNGSRFVVSDTDNNRIQVFGISGSTITHQVSFGALGSGNGQFNKPCGVSFSPDGARLVVADMNNHRIQVLGIAGNTISHQVSYGDVGGGSGQFRFPYGVAFSPEGGRLAVVDKNNFRVQVMGIAGNVITHQVSYGAKGGSGDGQFRAPRGVAYSPDGRRLIIAEYDNHRVQLLAIDGKSVTHIASFGEFGSGAGQFYQPFGGVAYSPDGKTVAVADTTNDRIALLGVDGASITFKATFGVPGSGDGALSRPYGVAFSPDGLRLAVSDAYNHRIQIFGLDGVTTTFQAKYGMNGSGNGQFSRPNGVSFSPDGLRLAVADQNNHRIQILGITGNTITHQLSYGAFGTGGEQFNQPTCVVFSPEGSRLMVADSTNHRIHLLAISGNNIKYIASCGSNGYNLGQLVNPCGAAFSPDGAHIVVADSNNNRIQIL